MLKIHEATRTDGSLSPTFLFLEDGVVGLRSDEGALTLPDGALEAVMTRFGKPLDVSEQLMPVGALELGDGRTLRHVRHLARWDVIARDWLVLEVAGEEPLCALATTVAGALGHLARAAAQRTS